MHYVLNDNTFCEPAFLRGVLFKGGYVSKHIGLQLSPPYILLYFPMKQGHNLPLYLKYRYSAIQINLTLHVSVFICIPQILPLFFCCNTCNALPFCCPKLFSHLLRFSLICHALRKVTFQLLLLQNGTQHTYRYTWTSSCCYLYQEDISGVPQNV